MIKRVRRQFIAITMTMLTAVLLIPLIALNVIIQMVTYDQTYDNLKQIASSEAATWEEENNMPDDLPAFHANDKDDDMNADEDTEESKTEAKTETTAASETTRKTEKTDENHIKRTDTVPADNGYKIHCPKKKNLSPKPNRQQKLCQNRRTCRRRQNRQQTNKTQRPTYIQKKRQLQ